MKQTVPRLIRRRKFSAPDVHLQRLVKQPRRSQTRVSLISQSDEFVGGDAVFDVLVLLPVLLNRHVRHGGASVFWGVVVTCPDLDVAWHGEELSSRFIQVTGAASWKVAAGCANVCVKDGVATEDVV